VEAAADAPTAGGVVVIDGAAIAAALPPAEYLVPGLSLVGGPGAPHLIAGYGYSGKTLALQSMLLSLAAGRRVWGLYAVTRSYRVLHVDLEQGERLTRRRYQRLAAAAEIDLAELGDRLELVSMPPGLTLTPECAPIWKRLMRGRDVILIDSYRAACPGQDENSSDARAPLDMLARLSEETGCRVIIIHHARKVAALIGAEEADPRYIVRGSSAIFDAVDDARVFGAARGEPISIVHIKARTHGDLTEDGALSIEDVTVSGVERAGLRVGCVGAEAIQDAREARRTAKQQAQAERDATRLVDALRAAHGRELGTRELRAAAGLSGERMARATAALDGRIERRQAGPGRPVAYRLVGEATTVATDGAWED
jgi:hypothetical protein